MNLTRKLNEGNNWTFRIVSLTRVEQNKFFAKEKKPTKMKVSYHFFCSTAKYSLINLLNVCKL